MKVYSFLKGNIGQADIGEKASEEELERVEAGVTVVMMYCVREASIFNKKKEKRKIKNKQAKKYKQASKEK